MWLDKLPIKKDYVLIAGSLLMLFIGYGLAFRPTITAWQMHKQLNQQLEQSSDLSYQPQALERENVNLTQILARYKIDTATFRSTSISAIALLAERNQVKLDEIPISDPLYRTENFSIQKLSFEGRFFDLLKFLVQLQQQTGIGIVRSINFKTIELRQSANSSKKLVLEVYLESINT